MRNVRLGKTFDAVLIHDAVSYLLTEADLRNTFATAAVHLRRRGVLLVAPDWVSETFPDGWVYTWERKRGDIEVEIEEAMVDRDPTDTQVESTYTYTIRRNGATEVERDTHVTGLFPANTWVRLMEQAGFSGGNDSLTSERRRLRQLAIHRRLPRIQSRWRRWWLATWRRSHLGWDGLDYAGSSVQRTPGHYALEWTCGLYMKVDGSQELY